MNGERLRDLPADAVVCTTPHHVTAEVARRTELAAAWFGVRLVQRRKRSVQRLAADEGARLIVVADEPLYIADPTRPEVKLFFHPGMAQRRIVALRRGKGDRMIRVAQVRPGDTVVDATFGLGVDSLVFAAAAGPRGRVIGLESSVWLARLFSYAQAHERHLYPMVTEALDRVTVIAAEHRAWLQAQPDDSADIVYFDPMFRVPLYHEHMSIEPARALTNPDPVHDDAWRHAQRVARRTVMLKERPGFGEFERFGIVPDKLRAKFAFGVWRKEGSDAGSNR